MTDTIDSKCEYTCYHLVRITGTSVFVFVAEDDSYISEEGLVSIQITPINDLPMVEIETPADLQSNDIEIAYTLSDIEGDSCSITVEYRGGSVDSTWTPAIVTGDTENLIPGSDLSRKYDRSSHH